MPEYLSQAAEDIGRAIHFESEENYGEAVDSYRNAVGTLLTSVQCDPCLKRQASVKRRIAQYIEKAETLMKLDRGDQMVTGWSLRSLIRILHRVWDAFLHINDFIISHYLK